MGNINRKTFYTHYTSIYDVSGEIENEMIQNLKRLIQESCIASRDFATYSVFKALNDLIYQDFNFYQNLLSHANAHGSLISKIKNGSACGAAGAISVYDRICIVRYYFYVYIMV